MQFAKLINLAKEKTQHLSSAQKFQHIGTLRILNKVGKAYGIYGREILW